MAISEGLKRLVADAKAAYESGKIIPMPYSFNVMYGGEKCGCGIGAAMLEDKMNDDNGLFVGHIMASQNKYGITPEEVTWFMSGFDSSSRVMPEGPENDTPFLAGVRLWLEMRHLHVAWFDRTQGGD